MKIMFNILFVINNKKSIVYDLFELIDFYILFIIFIIKNKYFIYFYIFCYIEFSFDNFY